MRMGRSMDLDKVDKAWLDVARDAGKQDRDGEIYLLRAEIERLRGLLASDGQFQDSLNRGADRSAGRDRAAERGGRGTPGVERL